MAQIKFNGNMIVMSRTMSMDKKVFETGADDKIFADVCNTFLQNGWSPISKLRHATEGDKVNITLEFTVPQNETTTDTTWLDQTDTLMLCILHAICTVIDNNDTIKQGANEFHSIAMENGIILLPAPSEEKPKMQTLIVYSTGECVEAFNKIMNTTYKTITTWPQGFEFVKLEKPQMDKIREQLTAIGCEHSVK